MKARYIVCCLWGTALFVTLSTAFAQYDYAYAVKQTTDGGYILVGDAHTRGELNVIFGPIRLMKIRSDGSLAWATTIGETDWPYSYHGYAVQQTLHGGYIVAGFAPFSESDAWMDAYLVRTGGGLSWSREYGGYGWDCAWDVQLISDGGYIAAGYTASFGAGGKDFYLIRTDDHGDTLWTHTYGGSSDEEAHAVERTQDGGYVLAGYTGSFGMGSQDFYLVKTDSIGDTLWTRTYGGSGDDQAWDAQQTTDRGYIMAGFTASFGAGNRDFYLVKTDSLGDTLWTRTYGGSNSDEANAVEQTTDGGYMIAGYTSSFGAGGQDFYLVKTDNVGDTLWTRTYGGNSDENAWDAQQTTDGGYVLAGNVSDHVDIYVVKTDSMGDALWTRTYGFYSKADAINQPPSGYALHQNYPNPFNPSTQIAYDLTGAGHVSLKVFDLLGREIRTLVSGVQSPGSHSVAFDGSELASGIYLYRLQIRDFVATKKMLLLK